MAYAIACRVGQGSVDLCIIEPSLVDFLARGLGVCFYPREFLLEGQIEPSRGRSSSNTKGTTGAWSY